MSKNTIAIAFLSAALLTIIIVLVVLHNKIEDSDYKVEIRIGFLTSLNLGVILKIYTGAEIFYMLILVAWGTILYLLLNRSRPVRESLDETFEDIYGNDMDFF